MCFAPQWRALFRHLNLQMWSEPLVFLTFWLGNVLRATAACTFSTSQLPKVVWSWGVLCIFTSKCASRHNGVHFFDISTSKSGPKLCAFWLRNVLRATTGCTFSTSQLPKEVRPWCVLYIFTWKCASRHNGVHFFEIWTSKSGPHLVCFVHFHIEMCFAPERRALFSTSQLPKVVRRWSVLYILTSKCASRHNGVQFFITHLASWLRTRRFSEPTFRPSGATNHWKNTVPFRASASSSYSFSSTLLSSNLPLLSASSLVCFSSVHIVGSLTSKLPSNKNYFFRSQNQLKILYITWLRYCQKLDFEASP